MDEFQKRRKLHAFSHRGFRSEFGKMNYVDGQRIEEF